MWGRVRGGDNPSPRVTARSRRGPPPEFPTDASRELETKKWVKPALVKKECYGVRGRARHAGVKLTLGTKVSRLRVEITS